jgi:hypothetical protein
MSEALSLSVDDVVNFVCILSLLTAFIFPRVNEYGLHRDFFLEKNDFQMSFEQLNDGTMMRKENHEDYLRIVGQL